MLNKHPRVYSKHQQSSSNHSKPTQMYLFIVGWGAWTLGDLPVIFGWFCCGLVCGCLVVCCEDLQPFEWRSCLVKIVVCSAPGTSLPEHHRFMPNVNKQSQDVNYCIAPMAYISHSKRLNRCCFATIITRHKHIP